MKILEITFLLQSGGAERFVVDLSNELAKTNEVTLLTLRDDTVKPELRNFYKGDISPNVHYDCLGLKDGLTPSMWWKIWNYIQHNKPDIVHFHGDGMAYWMFVPMVFSSRRIKFVQTIHSSLQWGGYTKCIYRWMIRMLCPSKRLRYAAISKTNYDDFCKFYPSVLSACIDNGRAPMSPTLLYEDVKKELGKYKTSDKTKLFLHVGRCDEVKNQIRLVTCFNKLIELGFDAQLIIIGDYFNEKEIGRQVQKMACPNIHFFGIRKNISDYQLNSDLFCLSSDSEGMPITIIEALLSGTPVVSTPVCGSVDAIVNGINGYLSEDFTDKAYLDALIAAYNNWESIKKNAMVQKDVNSYTIKRCAEKYIEFFKQ